MQPGRIRRYGLQIRLIKAFRQHQAPRLAKYIQTDRLFQTRRDNSRDAGYLVITSLPTSYPVQGHDNSIEEGFSALPTKPRRASGGRLRLTAWGSDASDRNPTVSGARSRSQSAANRLAGLQRSTEGCSSTGNRRTPPLGRVKLSSSNNRSGTTHEATGRLLPPRLPSRNSPTPPGARA